jgi:choline monooxygenase
MMPKINPYHSLCSVEPIERAETLPSACYTESSWHQTDVEQILKPRWQYVGHISQLKRNGDVLPLHLLGEPVLIVRDNDIIRAFYNVCKHRGGPIATEAGHCSMLQCKYHGWTYKLDGSLRGVPKFKYAELFDKKDYGLTQIPIEIWEGFIFIRLGNHMEPLTKQFGGITDAIHPIQLSNFRFHSRVTYTIRCNWKVYADNYLEGYHIPHVHPDLCELLDMDQYETVVRDWKILQISPLKNKNSIYQGGDNNAWYYYLYPNMMLNILPGRLQLNQILPIDENNCLVHFDYYYSEEKLSKYPKLPDEDKKYSDLIQAEDTSICEHVQLGLTSTAYNSGRFSVETEKGVYAFQSLIKKDYIRAQS